MAKPALRTSKSAGTSTDRGDRELPGQPKRGILSRWAWLAPLVTMAAMTGFSLWVGLRAIDFGHHWDEDQTISQVKRSAVRMQFMSDWFPYPSLTYDVACLSVLPDILTAARRQGADLAQGGQPWDGNVAPAWNKDLVAKVYSADFWFRVRSCCLAITLTSGLWVFLLMWIWRKSLWQGVLAGGLILLSWEVGYHARWIASDGLLMQFAALTLLLSLVSKNSPRPLLWTLLAAAAAGLGAGAKYTGGILLVTVLVTAAIKARQPSWGRTVRRFLLHGLLAGLVFLAVFLATSPSILVLPGKFLQDVHNDAYVYGSGHGGHDCFGVFDYAHRMLGYCGEALLSPYAAAALFFSAMALGGAYVLVRRSRAEAAMILAMPVLYMGYLCTQKVLIVRNLLLAAPVIAVLSAVGIAHASAWLGNRRKAAAWALPGLCALALAGNAQWGWNASQSIRQRSLDPEKRELPALKVFLAQHRERSFVLSQTIRDYLKADLPRFDNVLSAGGEPKSSNPGWVAFFDKDVQNWKSWPCNARLHYTLLPSAPLDVNWDYYPTWDSVPRIVLLPMKTIVETPLWEELQKDGAFPASPGK